MVLTDVLKPRQQPAAEHRLSHKYHGRYTPCILHAMSCHVMSDLILERKRKESGQNLSVKRRRSESCRSQVVRRERGPNAPFLSKGKGRETRYIYTCIARATCVNLLSVSTRVSHVSQNFFNSAIALAFTRWQSSTKPIRSTTKITSTLPIPCQHRKPRSAAPHRTFQLDLRESAVAPLTD